ncbi:MAG: DNA cytosine methyltransferase [Oscillibacter sp.]|nr:DNA cytosine methyltransferase [Oscillibacter sp.]
MIRTIDLFAGAGGITEGFRKAGYVCCCASDFDEEARHTFTFNHPDTPYLLQDIREVTADELLLRAECTAAEIDVITGGPPCQGFSLAGQRLADDPRNELFREYVRIAGRIQPKVIFFENVNGIMNMQDGKALAAILTEFAEIGYRCRYAVVNAADYGVPQARPRFVLIGVRGFDKAISFPEPTHGKVEDYGQLGMFSSGKLPYVTVEDALSNLPVVAQGEGAEEVTVKPHWDNEFQRRRVGTRNPGKIYNHRATRHSKRIQERYAMIPQGRNNSVLPPEIRTKKQNAYKLDMKKPARTVTCNFRTDLIHPTMNRGLTVREAARLQSFDDDYRFFGNLTRKAKWLTQDDQVGNAVPPLLAYAFAKHISDYILPQFD